MAPIARMAPRVSSMVRTLVQAAGAEAREAALTECLNTLKKVYPGIVQEPGILVRRFLRLLEAIFIATSASSSSSSMTDAALLSTSSPTAPDVTRTAAARTTTRAVSSSQPALLAPNAQDPAELQDDDKSELILLALELVLPPGLIGCDRLKIETDVQEILYRCGMREENVEENMAILRDYFKDLTKKQLQEEVGRSTNMTIDMGFERAGSFSTDSGDEW